MAMTTDEFHRRSQYIADHYDEICQRAASDQGLDPITDALREAGIPHRVDQTGGWCMVVHIPLNEGNTQYLMANDLREWNGEEGVLVGRYAECDEHDGWCETIEDWQIDLSELAALVRREAARSVPCPHC